MKNTLLFFSLLALLLLSAVGVVQLLPSSKQSVYESIAAGLPPSPHASEISAAVEVALHLSLNAEDIQVYRNQTARGVAPAEALRQIIDYREASNISK
ncbi:MAG: hypothetical protein RSD41_03160 [Kiritimatiellia bacterium]